MSSQSIRWLHISDAHFLSLAGYDQNRLANSLVASIPNLTKRFGDIDLIIFSGDVGNTGRQEEYSQATEFFSNILSACGLEKDRLVIVPGNHDVDRRGSTGLARSLTSRGEIDELFNGRDVPHITQRQAAFATWLQEFFEGERSLSQTSTVQSQVCLNIRGQKVSIWPINTAAFSFDEHDHGRLIIGLRCLEESALRAGEADLTIAVMHHPLSWLSDIERTPVTAMLRDNVDLILHGHLHENEVQLDSGSAGQAATLTAGATYQGSEWPNTASICEITDCALSVWPIHYVAKPREVWTLDTSLFPESESFSGQFQLNLKKMRSSSFSVVKQGPASNLLTTNVATPAWRGQLFTTPEGAALYVDPRLVLNQGAQASPAEDETVPISIADVVSSRESYIIESRPEYGGTLTLARLKEELEAAGEHVFQAHASSTPNYKSKLVEALTQATSTMATNIVVLLDGFEVERDQRLVSELKKTGLVSRMIVVSTNRSLNPTTDFEIEKMAFELNRLQLRPLGRAEIRKLCSIFFPHSGDESVATITGKVYDDLLALCIPLTPANVIMYLRILHAEGSYSPINRVDILDRFLTESLRRPSDSYTGAFNYKNKSDLAAAFSMQMFTEKRETFTDRYWYEFCDAFKRETLFEFVSKDLLDEFTGARIFARLGDTVFFRYSFFFTFFLGRDLSQHPGLLETFLDDQMYLSATDALDVVSSFRPNDPTIIDALSKQLESKLDDFAEAVCRRDFDPLLGAVWAPSDKEDELLWTPVAKAIESAPRDTNEIDKLKSSYLAEKRTEDQTLRIKKFLELEYALFITEYSLCDVFKNCNDVG